MEYERFLKDLHLLKLCDNFDVEKPMRFPSELVGMYNPMVLGSAFMAWLLELQP